MSPRKPRTEQGARQRAGSRTSSRDPLAELREQAAAAGLDLDELTAAVVRERLAAGKARARKAGKHTDGAVPYGYAHRAGHLEPLPEQAAIVRRIFTEAIDGRAPGRIARMLTAEGVPTPARAASWSAQGVRFMLTNSVYAGERHGVKRAHEPIVHRRTFNRAQAALAARARR